MIDHLLDRERSDTYTCMHYAGEVWLALTGKDIRSALIELLSGTTIQKMRPFTRLHTAISPCIVVSDQLHKSVHVGIHFDGSVAHLAESRPEVISLTRFSNLYTGLRYYK